MINISFPDWDRELFLYLNSKNHPWLDPVMILLSSYTAWFLLCFLIIGFMLYKDRVRGRIAAFFLILGIIVNNILNLIVKILIMRPRPGNEDLLKDLFNQLEATGTTYSFFSAHSSNSFCLAAFTALYFRNKIYGIVIFAWSMAVAYSRIYVGKHYPLDVLVGTLFGLLMGWMAYWFYKRYAAKSNLLSIPEEEEIL